MEGHIYSTSMMTIWQAFLTCILSICAACYVLSERTACFCDDCWAEGGGWSGGERVIFLITSDNKTLDNDKVKIKTSLSL